MEPSMRSTRRKSTRAFSQTAKQIPDFTFFDKIHGYIYLRWSYLYIGIAKGDHPLVRFLRPIWNLVANIFPKRDKEDPESITFADTYHGKVVPTKAAVQLVTIKEDIQIEDLEKIIPYQRARAIVLKNPDHIVVLECPCRSVSQNPCLPLDVCLIIGEPFATYVAEHHRERSRWITQDEATSILEAERDRGHVSHAFFKDAMLGRFYAICNCCKCCCGAMKAHQNGTPMLASSGYVAQVNTDLCIGCSECETVCQFNAISIVDDIAAVDIQECMGCAVCESHCTQGAISMSIDETKGIPLEIHKLMAEVL
jgi:Pyruvate/2-oxoacid:ferredoxin oxidoreductase delta subunit